MSARSNGLRAHAYSVLIEIEESLGDLMLVALAERQIAAYVVPAPGPGRAQRLILHVDAQRRVPAGIVLAGLTPAPAGEHVADADAQGDLGGTAASSFGDDAAFAEIVADFHRVPTERPWPAAEDLPSDPPSFPTLGPFPVTGSRHPSITVTPFPGTDSGAGRRRSDKPANSDDADHKSTHADRDADPSADHYVAPHLPRLAPSPPATRWALVALGLGLALMLFPTIFDLRHRTALDIAGVVCVLGATCVLLARLRDRSDDDPDDGAVV